MIDTNYLRDRCNISLWLYDQFRIEIKELCDAYDEQQRRIASLKLIEKDHKKLMCASHMGQIAREKLADENIKLRKVLQKIAFEFPDVSSNVDHVRSCIDLARQAIKQLEVKDEN